MSDRLLSDMMRYLNIFFLPLKNITKFFDFLEFHALQRFKKNINTVNEEKAQKPFFEKVTF